MQPWSSGPITPKAHRMAKLSITLAASPTPGYFATSSGNAWPATPICFTNNAPEFCALAFHVIRVCFLRTAVCGPRSTVCIYNASAMPNLPAFCSLLLTMLVMLITVSAQDTPAAKYRDFPSETPAKFQPVTDSFDYERRDVMIPMRDGVKLHTVILVPKGSRNAPILLTRT